MSMDQHEKSMDDGQGTYGTEAVVTWPLIHLLARATPDTQGGVNPGVPGGNGYMHLGS
jgi:hypothetical protein